ncbi:MAG: 50S ribosomal protein L17 [Candidatus Berkelbacteria bacterium]|nr:50S ribosomal protein L17 [Candidatus Berkelbacteria bacterium]
MRHRLHGKKLGRKRGHRRELIKNLITSLILYEKIITTETKGKIVKGEVEKILSLAKKKDLHSRRLILARLNSKLAVSKIFEDLNKQFKNKKSGFARIVKLDNRLGDNSPQVLVELLIKHKEEERKTEKVKEKKSKEKVKGKREERKPGFWDRLRGKGTQTREIRTATKKTIERTTSK